MKWFKMKDKEVSSEKLEVPTWVPEPKITVDSPFYNYGSPQVEAMAKHPTREMVTTTTPELVEGLFDAINDARVILANVPDLSVAEFSDYGREELKNALVALSRVADFFGRVVSNQNAISSSSLLREIDATLNPQSNEGFDHVTWNLWMGDHDKSKMLLDEPVDIVKLQPPPVAKRPMGDYPAIIDGLRASGWGNIEPVD